MKNILNKSKILVYIYELVYIFIYHIYTCIFKKVEIFGDKETVEAIISANRSISRFGDGEMDLIYDKSETFQSTDKELSNRLMQILKEGSSDRLLVGVPLALNDISKFTKGEQNFWKINLGKYYLRWHKYVSKKKYYSADISRFYKRYEDKSNCLQKVNNLKKMWNERDVIIVEGIFTFFGCGNDLLLNAKSIKRIECPDKEAWLKYKEIYNELMKADKDSLIIACLGPTASVLAYDLSFEGYQVLDLGHMDIEYEWMLKSSGDISGIPNKSFNGSKPKSFTSNRKAIEKEIIAFIV